MDQTSGPNSIAVETDYLDLRAEYGQKELGPLPIDRDEKFIPYLREPQERGENMVQVVHIQHSTFADVLLGWRG